MAVNITDPGTLRGVNVTGQGGDKLGKVDEVYLDNETEKPEWVAVKTGLFGSNISLVPVAAADFDGSNLTVPFSKDQVKNAPNHDPGREISADDERELFSYYGIPYGGETVTATGGPQTGTTGTGYSDTQSTTQTGTSTETRGTVGHDTSGPNTDDAMTRSEERVHVGTRNVEVGRARLRKYIVTENVTQTVPVSHEEVRIEREPITEANRGQAYSGADLSEEEHEVVLHAQEPVVSKETVPVERVRLDTEVVTGQETVTEQVRKEQVEVENEGVQGRTTRRNS